MQLMPLMHEIINKVSEKSVREIKVLNYRYTADLWWGLSGATCMLHKKYILQQTMAHLFHSHYKNFSLPTLRMYGLPPEHDASQKLIIFILLMVITCSV